MLELHSIPIVITLHGLQTSTDITYKCWLYAKHILGDEVMYFSDKGVRILEGDKALAHNISKAISRIRHRPILMSTEAEEVRKYLDRRIFLHDALRGWLASCVDEEESALVREAIGFMSKRMRG